MSANNTTPDRDAILFAFFEECERPTEQEVDAWVERYPEFAEDIRDHAAVRLEVVDTIDDTTEPDTSMLARGRSRALNAIYLARQQVQVASDDAAPVSWEDALKRKQVDIPALARKINIDRMVLAELSAGRMRLPIGSRLVSALILELTVTAQWLENCVRILVSQPRLGLAKSSGPPTIRNRSYEEIVRASSMPEERKRYWLGES